MAGNQPKYILYTIPGKTSWCDEAIRYHSKFFSDTIDIRVIDPSKLTMKLPVWLEFSRLPTLADVEHRPQLNICLG